MSWRSVDSKPFDCLDFLSVLVMNSLRFRRDSNPRSLPWQGSAITNFATEPDDTLNTSSVDILENLLTNKFLNLNPVQ